MNRICHVVTAALIGGIIWFFAASKPEWRVPPDRFSLGLAEEDLRLPSGRVLYAVVDRDGIYLGAQRFDPSDARVAITSILKEQQIPNLIIYGTDLARYGEVIELYAGISPGLTKWSTFSFRPVSVGTRKPLFGVLKASCCGDSYDVENSAY